MAERNGDGDLMVFVQVTVISLLGMNLRGLFSRSRGLAVTGLTYLKGDSSLDSVMVVDMERSRKMSDLAGKNQVDFVIGCLREAEERTGHWMTPRFQGWMDDVRFPETDNTERVPGLSGLTAYMSLVWVTLEVPSIFRYL